jgi:hypothetical protein
MSRSEFRGDAFFAALDSSRAARQLNWKQGKRPDVDSLAALVQWSGLSADPFVGHTAAVSPEPLSRITSLLYADESLSDDSRETMIEMITAAYSRSRRALRNEGSKE